MSPDFFLSHCKPSDIIGKKVLLRLDLDLPKNDHGYDYERINASMETIKLILSFRASKIGIIGHLGRPKGKYSSSLSVRPIYLKILKSFDPKYQQAFYFHENLRFNLGEENNNPKFAAELSNDYDLYVFDAFAVSHRSHASVVSIPNILPTFLGVNVEQEFRRLSRLFKPKKPYLAIVGGAKPETKIDLIHALAKKADAVLIGGCLAKHEYHNYYQGYKNVILAKLLRNELDISSESITLFRNYISKASTIVWNGPMGKDEESKYARGSRAIAKSIEQSPAYSIIGGGDTISFFKQTRVKMNPHSYLCMGGGAMLHYITHETLPILSRLKAA